MKVLTNLSLIVVLVASQMLQPIFAQEAINQPKEERANQEIEITSEESKSCSMRDCSTNSEELPAVKISNSQTGGGADLQRTIENNKISEVKSLDGIAKFIGSLGIFMLLAYLFPTMIAFGGGHPHKWIIFIVNLAFGYSGIGWVLCLIWALIK